MKLIEEYSCLRDFKHKNTDQYSLIKSIRQYHKSVNGVLYEIPPQWRTVKILWNSLENHYLYFPHMQFLFTDAQYEDNMYVFCSIDSYPSKTIYFIPFLRQGCLGEDWTISDHSHVENINQFWNTYFVFDGEAYQDLLEFKSDLNEHGEKVWNLDKFYTDIIR